MDIFSERESLIREIAAQAEREYWASDDLDFTVVVTRALTEFLERLGPEGAPYTHTEVVAVLLEYQDRLDGLRDYLSRERRRHQDEIEDLEARHGKRVRGEVYCGSKEIARLEDELAREQARHAITLRQKNEKDEMLRDFGRQATEAMREVGRLKLQLEKLEKERK